VNQGRIYLYQIYFSPKPEGLKNQALSIEVSKPASVSTSQQTQIRQGFEGDWDLVAYDSKSQKLSFYKALLDHAGIPFWGLKPQTVDLKDLPDFTRLNSSSWTLMSADESSIIFTNDDGFVYTVPLEGIFTP
jgi:hypothetical protein